MKKLFCIIICLGLIPCKGQELAKEALTFNDKKQVVSAEKEYRYNSNEKILYRYNGLDMILKYVKTYPDSTIVMWKMDKVGDSTTCFCIYADEIWEEETRYVCKKGTEIRSLEKGVPLSGDYSTSLREKNIYSFASYPFSITPKDIVFDTKEKFVYDEGKLIRTENYMDGSKVYTTYYSYSSNNIVARQYDEVTLELLLESRIHWSDNFESVGLEKNYFNHCYSTQEMIQIKDKSIQIVGDKSISLSLSEIQPKDYIIDRFFNYGRHNYIQLDHLAFNQINSYKSEDISYTATTSAIENRKIFLYTEKGKVLPFQEVEVITPNLYTNLPLSSLKKETASNLVTSK